MIRAFIVSLLLLLSAPAFAEPQSEALLKARIVQLEMQMAEAVRRINLLTAQLSEAQQPAIQQEQAKKRAEAEQEMGGECVGHTDWNVIPPSCKPAPKEQPPKP